ncbi:MAG TPA: hypothetical protein VGK10_13495 [Prolixibacteraceae bacterium]
MESKPEDLNEWYELFLPPSRFDTTGIVGLVSVGNTELLATANHWHLF